MTQIMKKEVKSSVKFTEVVWTGIVDSICLMNGFDSEMKAKILKHSVVKIIAATPFLAGCNNPLRIAMSHVAIYFLAASKTGKQTFVHSVSDDSNYLLRLERISHFDGGNKNVINKGMDLLALVMVEDYYRDMEEDKANNKYNPLVSGAWNYLQIKNELVHNLTGNDTLEFDDILDMHEALDSYWGIY